MPVRVEITGTEKFRSLAARLRAAEHDFKPEMGKALSDGARTLPAAARASALEKLPKRNGLNLIVARSRFRVRRISPQEVRVVATGIEQLPNTNDGFINHPTFDHRPRETQAIPKARGWFSDPMHRGKDKIGDAIGDAMHRIAKRIT